MVINRFMFVMVVVNELILCWIGYWMLGWIHWLRVLMVMVRVIVLPSWFSGVTV